MESVVSSEIWDREWHARSYSSEYSNGQQVVQYEYKDRGRDGKLVEKYPKALS